MNIKFMKDMPIKSSVVLVTGATLLSVLATPVMADSPYSPYNIYVGTPVGSVAKQVAVDKLVKNPVTGAFVDNVNSSSHSYLNTQEVVYRINVTNSGQVELTNINVTDLLPQGVNYVSSPANYDQNSRRINFVIPKLAAGQTYTLEYKAKVSTITNKGGVEESSCPINTVEVRVNDLYAKDQASICIGTQVLGAVQELPVTGPKEVAMTLGGSVLLMGMSVYLFRKYQTN